VAALSGATAAAATVAMVGELHPAESREAEMSETETISENPEPGEVFGYYQHQTEILMRTYHDAKCAFGFDIIERERDKLVSQVHKLEMRNQKLKLQYGEVNRRLESQSRRSKRRSFLVWILSLFALISSGMGINYVTGDNQAAHIPGWVMIGVAVVLEFLGFWIAHLWRN